MKETQHSPLSERREETPRRRRRKRDLLTKLAFSSEVKIFSKTTPTWCTTEKCATQTTTTTMKEKEHREGNDEIH